MSQRITSETAKQPALHKLNKKTKEKEWEGDEMEDTINHLQV